MRTRNIFAKSFAIALIVIAATNCEDPFDITEPQSSNHNQAQLFMKIAEGSGSLTSFTPNYNESEALAMAGILGKNLYPVHIQQKMTLVDKNLILAKDSTSAVGTLVQNYEGKLIIQGSFQPPTIGIRTRTDTTIQKTFSTTITRLIHFKKVANTGNDTLDWKVNAISLPYGGTDGNNIQIVKLTLTSQNGTPVEITDPGLFLFKIGKEKKHDRDDEDDDNNEFEENHFNWKYNWKDLKTWYKKNQKVNLRIEVLSNISDPDFLTVTYGAMMNGVPGKKAKFDIVSTVQDGSSFRKVYELNFYTNANAVRMHAVINAYTRNSVYDTESAVESKSWGIPYRVK